MSVPGVLLVFGVLSAIAGCAEQEPASVTAVPERPGAVKAVADVRAARRAYDGAPAVIPHASFGAACVSCHTVEGMAVADVGFAPPSPHEATAGMHAAARCEQCHVYQRTEDVWRSNAFAGLAQDLRRGKRQSFAAPPVVPHAVFMRENCAACHAGPAAREEIRTSHPERLRCRQCHLERVTGGTFVAAAIPKTED